MCAAREARAKEDDAALPSTMFVRISAHGVTVKDLVATQMNSLLWCAVRSVIRDARKCNRTPRSSHICRGWR